MRIGSHWSASMPNQFFTDVTDSIDPDLPAVNNLLFFDYDNDGRVDLFFMTLTDNPATVQRVYDRVRRSAR